MLSKNEQHKKKLIERYTNNEISEKEFRAFFGLLSTEDFDALLEANMDLEILEIRKGENKVQHTTRLWPRIAAAAAIFLIIGAGLIFYNHHARTLRGPDPETNLAQIGPNDIKPGSNKAYLTLANGKRLSLTDAGNGKLAKEAGVEISKTADGQVVYTSGGPGGKEINHVMNTIETPRGGQYQVRLPDGSNVWLNAASKLVYPVSFRDQKERKVILTGEAYFEIAKDKQHPFHVKTAGQDLEVLGTHFNVNHYIDERSTRTTLLEGSIRISPDRQSSDAGVVVLKPGQQSILAAGKINITEVDVEEAVAWKQGVFNFNNEDIGSIMRKLARWYDVEIIYEGKISNVRFGAEISRSRSLAQVLKVLEKTEGIKFKIEGRRVTVMP